MIEDDSDLKRMFAAQREIDEQHAPVFDCMVAKSHVTNSQAGKVSPADPAQRKSRSAVMVVAVTATILVLAVGWVTWIKAPSSLDQTVTATSQADLQRIDELCDSLLQTIRTMDHAASDERFQDQEMQWPTGTDSLLVTRTVSLNVK